ncbi:hypothetical protein F2P81_000240 [Scophthalmus maximus]|uniref:Uncharacterized protein n=1 Tax=Scophthalmus maximus TaxID=52904 RepID=A0A6A4TIN4_SCOMX|nr:hypothetical protein F2P81_000240 [Scophthalmus maximus]
MATAAVTQYYLSRTTQRSKNRQTSGVDPRLTSSLSRDSSAPLVSVCVCEQRNNSLAALHRKCETVPRCHRARSPDQREHSAEGGGKDETFSFHEDVPSDSFQLPSSMHMLQRAETNWAIEGPTVLEYHGLGIILLAECARGFELRSLRSDGLPLNCCRRIVVQHYDSSSCKHITFIQKLCIKPKSILYNRNHKTNS